MIILSVGQLTNKFYAGTNINIPKFVIELNKKAGVESGYLDFGSEDLIKFKGFKNYFKITDYQNFTIDKLPTPFNRPDIVVFQGFYTPGTPQFARQLVDARIPYTIVPRCSMTKKAQQDKRLKKIIGNAFLFNRFVREASFIHFLTKNEYEESKNTFKFNNHVIIGNGVEIPKKQWQPKNRKEFKITFVGRYNVYHKGLDLLLKSVVGHEQWFQENNVTLNLYGKTSEGGKEWIEKFVQEKSLEKIVKINDGVFDNEKEKVLLDADVFVHTSRLEGHPTSVIEALSYGIPVIVTPGTNMAEDVSENKLGWVTEADPEEIFKTIKKCFEDKKNIPQFSRNARSFAIENFDWKKISEKIKESYGSEGE